jgi:glycosyltransferase involved in cell wall biosynthesis
VTLLLDVHHLGMQQTGNETWVRNMAAVVCAGARPGEVALAVGPAGVDQARRLAGPAAPEPVLVSGSSARRLMLDLPRAVRQVEARALLAQYTAPLSRVPVVLAVHDLSFEDPASSAWLSPRSRLRMRASVALSARRAATVLALTEWGRQDLLRTYGLPPESVVVAGAAVDPELAALLDGAPPREPAGRLRVLAVGNVLPRKNLVVVARAVHALVAQGLDCELRVVGQVPAGGQEQAAALDALLGDRLSFTGYVSTEELATEYRQARALAFPSLFEGFGIPILEAMTAGLPVVASTATCLPEVVGTAGLLAGPADANAWTGALGRVLTDGGLHAQLVQDGRGRAADFSWERSGQTALQALRRAAA